MPASEERKGWWRCVLESARCMRTKMAGSERGSKIILQSDQKSMDRGRGIAGGVKWQMMEAANYWSPEGLLEPRPPPGAFFPTSKNWARS